MIKQHSELSTMFAFCCTVSSKILFYLILICYHMVDIVFDWKTFAALLRDNKFSGVSISKSEESMIQILFGLSCVTGTIFSVAMIVAYKNYIKHHWHCMNNASFDLASHYSNGNVWFSPDIRGDKKCDRKLVSCELWISVLELFLKDIIQSGILFWAHINSGTSNPDWESIVFSVCSIVAHLKLCLCFLTKGRGWVADEERCGKDSVRGVKAFLCSIGFVGSAICLGLTAVAFLNEVS